jgi:hypothetical protein
MRYACAIEADIIALLDQLIRAGATYPAANRVFVRPNQAMSTPQHHAGCESYERAFTIM